MRTLFAGLHQFHKEVYEKQRNLFEKLSSGQKPVALFIGCSDSRVVPDLIMMTNPGELFILRNAGNIVPPFGASTGGEAATIEFAVSALNVSDIIVCGHSQCGAIKALLNPASTEKLPMVRQWLLHAETTRRIMEENYPALSPADRYEVAIQEHVLVQLENLQTHPAVAVKLQRNQIALHGWIYQLETGQVHAFSPNTGVFEPLMGDKSMDSAALAQPVTSNVVNTTNGSTPQNPPA